MLIEEYGRKQGLTPEELYQEKFKRKLWVLLVRFALRILDSTDQRILVGYCIDKRTFEDLGKELGIAKNNVLKRLNNMPKKIRKRITRRTYVLCRALLLDNPSTTEASTPKHHIGWLGTRLTNVYAGASWELAWDRSNHKTLQYISKTECLLPEYLQDSFGDSETFCGYCGNKCSRKENQMVT